MTLLSKFADTFPGKVVFGVQTQAVRQQRALLASVFSDNEEVGLAMIMEHKVNNLDDIGHDFQTFVDSKKSKTEEQQ